MSWANWIPLAIAVVLVLPVALAPYSSYANRIVSRFALVGFGSYVERIDRKKTQRKNTLRAAHLPTTYRIYAAKTVFYSAVLAIVGSMSGMYVIWGTFGLLSIDEATIRSTLPQQLHVLADFTGLPSLTIYELFVLMLVTSATVGLVFGGLTYWLRWWYPSYRADERARRIEASLPQTIAFVYALSRSGMEFPKVMRILAANKAVYGDAADEVNVAVRNMDMFGQDMISAIHTMAHRTPSGQFKEFSENLASVLQSGRSLSSFLQQQYEDYQEEAESQQEKLLDLLATLAEVYVTGLVAGPLFLITILVVIGIAVSDTLQPLQVLVYVIVPSANLLFIIYLLSATDTISQIQRIDDVQAPIEKMTEVRRAESTRTDGGTGANGDTDTVTGANGDTDTVTGGPSDTDTVTGANGDTGVVDASAGMERLREYRRLRWLRARLGSPGRTVIERPVTLFWVTVPIALLVTALRFPETLVDGQVSIRAFDDLLVQGTLFVVGTFAIVYEVHRRRLEAIESAVPDLMDRLASVNEAGMTVVQSIERVRRSELGALDPELDRVWRDIEWGADVETALKRFESRLRTQIISRVVTLTTKAMNASGDLSTVLRIAGSQAKADRRLKQRRQQEMLTYMVVVYVSFFVFLFIIGVLSTVLIPNLPDGGTSTALNQTGGGATGAGVGGIGGVGGGGVNTEAYTLLFFHSTLLQGVLSGLIAGQLATGDVRGGAKHAAVLLAIAYGVFLLLL
ncbi:type II secretion protein F [Halorubellus sp. JP-L1]|uniref:type II secretion system F family protein n=1 Tax=Halorubellus sp. JP-L1 TaxID=2715753 RepID=UPI00140AF224|nr:type II secretion system F family protein [Halorubellus sp. JP-L1]NHN40629.1 type II secretion protein F [Halorubellus sp. JP-L1]